LVFFDFNTLLIISICHSFFLLQSCLGISWTLHYNLFFRSFITLLLVHIWYWLSNNYIARLDSRTFAIFVVCSGRNILNLNLSLSASFFPLPIIIHSLSLHQIHFIVNYFTTKNKNLFVFKKFKIKLGSIINRNLPTKSSKSCTPSFVKSQNKCSF